MSKLSRCYLTAMGFSILEVLLERRVNDDEAYLCLLRHKLGNATVTLWNDLPAEVATINSRVQFTVNGQHGDSRILVHGGEQACPGMSLPITTLRGLALLGLAVGESIGVETSSGEIETLHLEAICYQPERYRKERRRWESLPELAVSAQQDASVISLVARAKPVAPPSPDGPIDPDDDPGPRAA